MASKSSAGGAAEATDNITEFRRAARTVEAVFRTFGNARELLARGLGQSFNGLRNLYTTFGYTEVVKYDDMLKRYVRQDIVSRIVNAYPDAIWTRPPEIIGNEALSKNLWDLDAEIGLFHYVNRADRLAGIGKYSVLFFGFDDAKSTAELANPVADGNRKLLYVQAFGESDAVIARFNDSPTSSNFGMPETYSIKLFTSDRQTKDSGRIIDVHHSRVLHIADCLLDNDIYGYPIMERIYNRLDDIEKVVGGSAEMFWLSGRGGMQIDVDKETKFTVDDSKKLKENLEDYINDLQRIIRTKGVNIKELGGRSINPEPVFNVIMSMISITTGIPQRIFIGSEQGKLASEQDRANWAIRLDERRKLFAEPRVMRPMIAMLQQYGVFADGDYSMQWPEAFRMSPLERAQTAAQQARSATNLSRSMQDFAKIIEGVDYPLLRPTQQFTSIGGGGGSGTKFHAAKAPTGTPANDTAKTPPNDKSGGNADGGTPPPAPKPIEIKMEQIQLPRRELISIEEARTILFARGELKSEGKIDGVMD